MRRFVCSLCLLLCVPPAARAQFALTGDDPGYLKWSQIVTPHYKVIFPSLEDSLGRAYAAGLEYWYPRVSVTIGVGPNENYRKPLPVILHTRTAVANGVVTWLPRRMDLFTTPDANFPMPMPWMDQLATHEARHASQMQIGHDRRYTVFNVLLGGFFPGAMAALYGGPAFFEGDAVSCETEVGGSGRGRSGSFLEYYRWSSFNGEKRDYWQWRYGSQRRYTPDYYRAGYISVAGVKALNNDPEYTKRFYANIRGSKWPFPFFLQDRTTKEACGKGLNAAFKANLDSLSKLWAQQAEARAPYTEDTVLTRPLRLHTEYRSLCVLNDTLYAIRSGLDRTAELVSILDDGTVKRICAMASSATHLRADNNLRRIYWSETVADPRWSLGARSEIRYLDASRGKNTLTRRGRLYNPEVSADGLEVYAVEYPVGGGSSVVALSPDKGEVLRRYTAPEGVQLSECVPLGGHLVASAVTSEGTVLYDVTDGFRLLRRLGSVTAGNLFVHRGRLCFTSDEDGTDELYSFDGKALVRETSTLVGAGNFAFKGDSLYYSALSRGGRMVRRAVSLSPTSLYPRAAFPEAEALSGQYRQALAKEAGRVAASDSTQKDFEPKPYSKIGNLFRFHSWAPLFIDYDAVSSLSADNLASVAAVGATAFFQNDLSTASGYAGAAFRPSNGWRPELHARFTYSGWYPVLEASVDFNDRKAYDYYPEFVQTLYDGRGGWMIKEHLFSKPAVTGTMKAYIPWNFSSGGWSRGIIPQLALSASNDRFSDGKREMTLATATASIRAYCMRTIPSSCIYPRWGVGAELGYSSYLGMTDLLKSATTVYGYCYIPGFWRTHGVKITALGRFGSSAQTRFTLDYALPFAAVDWSFLGPVAYIRNFELTAHGVLYTNYSGSYDPTSVGADICVRLGNLLWVPYDTRLGLSLTWNPALGKLYPGLVFSVSM